MPSDAALHSCFARLSELDTLLRARGFSVSPGRWTSACDLLTALSEKQQFPATSEALCALLSPLFCQSPEDQETFKELFTLWIEEDAEALAHTEINQKPDDGGEPPPPPLITKLWFVSIVAVAATVCLLAVYVFHDDEWDPRVRPGASTEAPDQIIDIATDERPPSSTKGQAAQTVTAPELGDTKTDQLPRLPAEPRVLPGAYAIQVAVLKFFIWAVPAFVFMVVIVLSMARFRYVLKKEKIEGQHPLIYLRAKQGKSMPFALSDFTRKMRRSQLVSTRTLHAAQTIKQTLNNAGLFKPAWRQRHVAPEYVVLISRPHNADLLTVLGDTLVTRMRQENISVTRYYFKHDPRWCYDNASGGMQAFNIPTLATRHPDARLVIVGDGNGFASEFNQEVHSWVSELNHWRLRFWFTNRPQTWGYIESQFAYLGFHVAPLNNQGIEAVATWLQNSEESYRGKAGFWFGGSVDTYFPQHLFTEGNAKGWRKNTAVENKKEREYLSTMVDALADYLTADTWLLLCAVSAYPQLNGHLTLALEQRLFPLATPSERAQRLLALSQLPWSQSGEMPGKVRAALLYRLSADDFKKIGAIYESLLQSTQNKKNAQVIALSKQVVSKNKALKSVKTTFNPDLQTRDALLLSVLKGRRSRLDFMFPSRLTQPRGDQFFKRLRTRFIVVTTLAVYALLYTAWAPIEGGISNIQFQRAAAVREDIRLAINMPESMISFVDELTTNISAQGFQSDNILSNVREPSVKDSYYLQFAKNALKANWRAVASNSEGTWVAVGSSGAAQRSFDGLRWHVCATPTRERLTHVAVSQSKDKTEWMAAGDNGVVLLSKDGCDWYAELSPLPSTSDIRRLITGNDNWLVLTDAGEVFDIPQFDHSADVPWQAVDFDGAMIRDIAHANDRWFAVGEDTDGMAVIFEYEEAGQSYKIDYMNAGYADSDGMYALARTSITGANEKGAFEHISYSVERNGWLAIGDGKLAFSREGFLGASYKKTNLYSKNWTLWTDERIEKPSALSAVKSEFRLLLDGPKELHPSYSVDSPLGALKFVTEDEWRVQIDDSRGKRRLSIDRQGTARFFSTDPMHLSEGQSSQEAQAAAVQQKSTRAPRSPVSDIKASEPVKNILGTQATQTQLSTKTSLNNLAFNAKRKQFVVVGNGVILASNPDQQGVIFYRGNTQYETAKWLQGRLNYLNYDVPAFAIHRVEESDSKSEKEHASVKLGEVNSQDADILIDIFSTLSQPAVFRDSFESTKNVGAFWISYEEKKQAAEVYRANAYTIVNKQEWAGRSVSISPLRATGESIDDNELDQGVIEVQLGTDVELNFSWNIAVKKGDIYCPGCIVQYYLGVAGQSNTCFISEMLSPGRSRRGINSYRFTAPNEPGIHYLNLRHTLEYSCIDVDIKPNADEAFLKIIVSDMSKRLKRVARSGPIGQELKTLTEGAENGVPDSITEPPEPPEPPEPSEPAVSSKEAAYE